MDTFINLLRCPTCHTPLRSLPGKLVCAKKHIFRSSGRYIIFKRDRNQGKYDEDYSKRYAFLWAYGYETRHSGAVESLYRSVGALVAESLADIAKSNPVAVDCGCGTGRCIADAALVMPSARFVGVDLSTAKLDLAAQILKGQSVVRGSLPGYGFAEPLSIKGRRLKNVLLAQADVMSLPLQDRSADLALFVNLLDRVPDPHAALREAHRILRSGGALVLTTPLNWTKPKLWRKYPNAKALRDLISNCGFIIKIWFDQLLYREILDGRGSVEEFATLVISAQAR